MHVAEVGDGSALLEEDAVAKGPRALDYAEVDDAGRRARRKDAAVAHDQRFGACGGAIGDGAAVIEVNAVCLGAGRADRAVVGHRADGAADLTPSLMPELFTSPEFWIVVSKLARTPVPPTPPVGLMTRPVYFASSSV